MKVVEKELPLIKVNDKTIDEELLACELQYHQHEDFETVVQQAGQALVIRQLLLEQADKKGLDKSSNEDEVVKNLLDKVAYNNPSEEDCERYFEKNPHKFMSPTLMDVDHILLAAPRDDLLARINTKNRAFEIIAKLEKNPLLFAALAEQYSSCPSKKTGGFLGQVSKGQAEPEFERQLMLLGEGLALKPIESRYGFHVVNIHRKIEGEPLDYHLMADKVRAYLVHNASRVAIQKYIRGLIGKAQIEGIDLDLDVL